jgi:hypothetical protein
MLVLFIPLIQSNLKVFKMKPLFGAAVGHADTAFSWPAWFSGRFQAKREDAISDSFGLRELYIRIRNEVDFDVFRKTNTGDIIAGDSDRLFDVGYARAYGGFEYLGVNEVINKVKKLKAIQEAIRARNKTFLVVLAPGRGTFEPEYLPARYRTGRMNNYECFAALLNAAGVNHIDFNGYFKAMKGRTRYPLYYKYGAHWSEFGACLAGDSIVKRIEQMRNIKMIHPDMSNVKVEEENGGDVELESELNLIRNLKRGKAYVFDVKRTQDSTKIRPTVMIIGDSYFWGLAVDYSFWDEFSNGIFCYYFHEFYRRGASRVEARNEINLEEEIGKADIIIVEATEKNYADIGCAFTNEAYNLLCNEGPDKYWINPKYIQLLKEKREGILGNKDAMKYMEAKARDRKLPLDSMVTLDAIWYIEHAGK